MTQKQSKNPELLELAYQKILSQIDQSGDNFDRLVFGDVLFKTGPQRVLISVYVAQHRTCDDLWIVYLYSAFDDEKYFGRSCWATYGRKVEAMVAIDRYSSLTVDKEGFTIANPGFEVDLTVPITSLNLEPKTKPTLADYGYGLY